MKDEEEKQVIIFYHRVDLDGKCSGAIAKKGYPDAEMYGINYGDVFPWEKIKEGMRIVMVDFSLPLLEMIKLKNNTDFIWIDHHKTALDEMAEYLDVDQIPEKDSDKRIMGIQRDGVGACVLTWEFFFGRPIPPGVRLLGEYDVWNHRDPDTLPFQYGMRSIENHPESENWDLVFSGDLDVFGTIKEAGETILRWVDKDNEKTAQSLCFATELDGLRLLAANRGPTNSKLFDSVLDPDKYDAVCAFFWRPSIAKWNVSLFAGRDGVDVGSVCKARGGGGHEGAAGFTCDELPFGLNGVGN